jgi:rhodanese-related sulfurtransferase
VTRSVRIAIREAVIILVVVVLVSLVFNSLRKNGIPLVAEEEAFRIRTRAEFIAVEDARRLFDQGRAIFIDAREPEMYGVLHVEGALNLPASAQHDQDVAWLRAADSYVICYGSEQSPRPAGVIADYLLDIGVRRVRVLLGGLGAWEKSGFPTESGGD